MEKDYTTVFAIYSDRSTTERGIEALKAAGFRSSDVSVLMHDAQEARELKEQTQTKAPEGAGVGAGTGALFGGAFGWLAGIGALAIPGIGPLVAAGPIAAGLVGVGVGAAVGGLSGALVGYGISELQAAQYEEAVKKGGVLITVQAHDAEWVKRAKDILERTQAEHITASKEPVVTPARTNSASFSSKPTDRSL